MSLVQINFDPEVRQLRQFGCICLIALPGIGWLWGAGQTLLIILAAIGLVMAIAGFVFPAAVKPFFLGLSLIAAPIGMVVGEIAMMAVYYLVFMPIGLVFRLLRRDALQLKIDRSSSTYWQDKARPADAASYYRQS